jgi:glyoxylase-like metal-dependent hydrolase (beta-lactamase superfamily II)
MKTMKIAKLNYQPDFCNTYVVGEEGGNCVVIDPGYNENHVLERYLQKHQKKVLGILITHGHYDHIKGLGNFEGIDQIPVFMDELDFPCLTDTKRNVSTGLFDEPLILENIHPYPAEDEDEIKLGNWIFKVIETPFHTMGSVCYWLEDEAVLFSGDTLFHLGVGRSDLPGSCPRNQADSLHKLALLPPETKVYPGHGPSTSIGAELSFNPEFR